jgi:ribosomal protein S18 acetylase RimI-like enzyme
MDIKISPLSKNDLDAVMALSKKTPEFDIGSNSPSFYGIESLSTWLDDSRAVALVAMQGGVLAGFLLGEVRLGRDGFINMTVIDEPYRRKGIASKLTKVAEKAFAERGCNRVWSTVEADNKPMQSLKKKLGYTWGKQNYKLVDKMIKPKKAE